MNASETEENLTTEGSNRSNIKMIKNLRVINIGYVLFIIGILLCAISIDYYNNILALMGTSIIFWGALLVFFKPHNYISKDVAVETVSNYYHLINGLIEEFDFNGRPIYYTPSNIFGLRNTVLLIHNSNEFELDIGGITTYALKMGNSDRVLKVIPPGQSLSQKIEEKAATRFSSLDILDFQGIIETVIVDDFELAKGVRFDVEEAYVNLEVVDSVFSGLYNDSSLGEICRSIGDPLISSIACGISRSKHKPVIINSFMYKKGERKTIVRFKILDEIDSTSSNNISQLS